MDYVNRLLGLAGTDDPLKTLTSTAGRLSLLVARCPVAQRAARPGPDRWSLNEIAAHVADAEVVAAYRLRQILASSGIPIQAFDQDVWATAFKYGDMDAVTSVSLFDGCRRGTIRVLHAVDRDRFDHHGQHEERGRETVHHLLRFYAGHDINHLQQIERTLVDLGVAESGPFTPAAPRPEVPFEAIQTIDLRVGTITAVDVVPSARKVVRLTVDFGRDSRTVMASLREERTVLADLVGRQALFYYNLAPRAMHGEMSTAMLCDAGYADSLLPALLMPERPVPAGTRAG
jgi:tRNA-binding EMAP/Myf-like protein